MTALLHISIFHIILKILTSIILIIIIFRFGRLFWYYINTGNIGDFEENSGLLCIINDSIKAYPVLFFGTHPGAIFIDATCLFAIAAFAGILWPIEAIIMVTILPVILLAMLLRKRIARKQEFIAKLDGTYNNE